MYISPYPSFAGYLPNPPTQNPFLAPPGNDGCISKPEASEQTVSMVEEAMSEINITKKSSRRNEDEMELLFPTFRLKSHKISLVQASGGGA